MKAFDNIVDRLGGSETWSISFLLLAFADISMTMIGVYHYGTAWEANPIVRTAIDDKLFWYPFLTVGFLVFMFERAKNNWERIRVGYWLILLGYAFITGATTLAFWFIY